MQLFTVSNDLVHSLLVWEWESRRVVASERAGKETVRIFPSQRLLHIVSYAVLNKGACAACEPLRQRFVCDVRLQAHQILVVQIGRSCLRYIGIFVILLLYSLCLCLSVLRRAASRAPPSASRSVVAYSGWTRVCGRRMMYVEQRRAGATFIGRRRHCGAVDAGRCSDGR